MGDVSRSQRQLGEASAADPLLAFHRIKPFLWTVLVVPLLWRPRWLPRWAYFPLLMILLAVACTGHVLSVVVFDKRAENKSYHVFKLLSFAFWVACGLVHANTKQLASLLDFSLNESFADTRDALLSVTRMCLVLIGVGVAVDMVTSGLVLGLPVNEEPWLPAILVSSICFHIIRSASISLFSCQCFLVRNQWQRLNRLLVQEGLTNMQTIFRTHSSLASWNTHINGRNEVFLSLFITSGMMLSVIDAFSGVQPGAVGLVWIIRFIFTFVVTILPLVVTAVATSAANQASAITASLQAKVSTLEEEEKLISFSLYLQSHLFGFKVFGVPVTQNSVVALSLACFTICAFVIIIQPVNSPS